MDQAVRLHRPAPDTTAPSVPAGVTVAAQSPTQILVSWTASTDAGAGVAGYRVYRDGGATRSRRDGTSYTDTGSPPAPLQLHRARIRRRDAANESAPSAAASATTPAPA